MRGAEAVLHKSTFLGHEVVVKERIPKRYREKKLDEKLRRERTRAEAKLLHRAKLAGVSCPTVLSVSFFGLVMTHIDGKRPRMGGKECREAGRLLAMLHKKDVIHGDYTPANLLKEKGRLCVIDFGLGFFSSDVEDKAVDVFTMLRSVEHKKEFLKGYSSYEKSRAVLKRERQVESRVRYVEAGKRV